MEHSIKMYGVSHNNNIVGPKYINVFEFLLFLYCTEYNVTYLYDRISQRFH